MKKATKSKPANKPANKPSKSKPAKSKSKPANESKHANEPLNEPAKLKSTKDKKAKSPNVTKKARSPQNTMSPNNFEEAYRAIGVGMTRAQFKAQY
jgi:hypothetical protein